MAERAVLMSLSRAAELPDWAAARIDQAGANRLADSHDRLLDALAAGHVDLAQILD